LESPNAAPVHLTTLSLTHTLGGILKGPKLKLLKLLVAGLIAAFALTALTACAAEKLDASSYAQIIDVRTLDEWNSGHLEGAIRMGIADVDFADQLSMLDPSRDYYVYCRSGNRAGQAIDLMRDAGFTGQLINGGSVSNASKQLDLEVTTN
jgi:phage shock protein E